MGSQFPLEDHEPMAVAAHQFMAEKFPACKDYHLQGIETGRGAGEHYEIDVIFEQGIVYMLSLYVVDEVGHSWRPPQPYGELWTNGNLALRPKSILLHTKGLRDEFVPCNGTTEAVFNAMDALKIALSKWE